MIYYIHKGIFDRDNKHYINILFKHRKEDWKLVLIKNMQVWIDIVYQEMKCRSDNNNFSFNIQEYL